MRWDNRAEGLVELRRNRIAVVATPSWQEARDAFDIRIELERLVVRQLAGKLTKAQVAELTAHVDAEDGARDGTDAVSIRLATAIPHPAAHMTSSPILVRYVSEVAYRCCLTLSLYSRPHSSECAINEHRAIIAALVKGDESKVMGLMHSIWIRWPTRALVVLPRTRPRFAGYSGAVRGGWRQRAGGEDAEGGAGEVAVIASEAKQSISPRNEEWIASSLCSSQ